MTYDTNTRVGKAMTITFGWWEWGDARADELFRESERQRGGVRPATAMPQDYLDYFVVQAARERLEARAALNGKETP